VATRALGSRSPASSPRGRPCRATTDAAISTTGLTKRYGGGVVALDHLNLTVPSGSIFGFLGPNGAGKTTTLRLLTGLATATGRHGHRSRRAGSAARAASWPATSATWTRTRASTLDARPRAAQHGRAAPRADGAALRQRVGEVLEIVGLTDAASRRIGGYSGGMRQRLGIGQALINQPRVLFLDEPVSSLDPEGRRDVLEIISRLRGTATVFMSTHILNDVERVCDRVAILNVGHLVVEGPIDELLDRYAQPIYEIEPEPQQDGAIDGWPAAMRGQAWAREVKTTPDTVRVFVERPEGRRAGDPAAGHRRAASTWSIRAGRPSLEDVFLRLVAESGPAIAPPVAIPAGVSMGGAGDDGLPSPAGQGAARAAADESADRRGRRLRPVRDPRPADRPLHEGADRRHRQRERRLHVPGAAAESLEGDGSARSSRTCPSSASSAPCCWPWAPWPGRRSAARPG
jgi:ABC-2 type transport system ATP-binding protein